MQSDFEASLSADFSKLIVEPLLSPEAEAADWLARAGGTAPDLGGGA